MIKPTLALALVAIFAATAHAGPDPAAIQKDIDHELKLVDSKLGGGAVAPAIASAGKLVALYDKLDDVTTGTAKSDAQKGKEDAGKLKVTLEALDQLVQHQDQSLDLATWCARGQLMISEAIKRFEQKQDAQAITVLPAAAESARKLVEPQLKTMIEMRRSMDGWYRTVGSFSPKLAVWRDIRAELRTLGDRSYKRFVAAFDKTEEACQRVAKGKHHPEVLATLKLLQASHGRRAQDLAGIEKEIQEYATMIGGFRAWYRKDTDAVAAAFCQAGEKWGTSDVDRTPILAVLGRAKAELAAQAQRIDDEYALLAKALIEAKQLPGSAEEAKRINDALAAIAKVHSSFTKAIKDDPLAQGANNPKIRMRMEAGKLAHTAIQNRCTEKEIAVDASNRIDCFQACKVIEIKPDTKSGRRDGAAQRTRYKAAIDGLFKNHDAFVKKLPRLAKDCVKNGQLTLDYQVVYYKFCPASYDDLGFGPDLDARISNPQVLMTLELDGK